MFVRNRSIASTVSCLSRDRRSDRSSLVAENGSSTLTCVTGSAASYGAAPQGGGGYDGMIFHT